MAFRGAVGASCWASAGAAWVQEAADVFLARGLLRRRDALPLRGRGRAVERSALGRGGRCGPAGGRAGTPGGVGMPARRSGGQTVVRANAFSIRSFAAPLMTRSARAAVFSASVLPWAGATWLAYSVSAL